MVKAAIALGAAALALAVLALAMGVVPVHLVPVAPMGTTVTVLTPGDGSRTLYARPANRIDRACTVTRTDGTSADLRSDMFARPIPGSPAWQPVGALIDKGPLTIRCTDPRGGSFGVGPTRSIGWTLLLATATAAAAGLGVSAVVVALVARRRSSRYRGPDSTFQKP